MHPLTPAFLQLETSRTINEFDQVTISCEINEQDRRLVETLQALDLYNIAWLSLGSRVEKAHHHRTTNKREPDQTLDSLGLLASKN